MGRKDNGDSDRANRKRAGQCPPLHAKMRHVLVRETDLSIVANALTVRETTRVPSEMNDDPSGGILIPIGTKPWKEKQHYTLRRDRTTIGRSSHCDIRINDPTVSRLHAELAWAAGDLMLKHLSPVNPTLVNGVPVGEACALRTGDVIELADGIALQLELFARGDDDVTVRGRDSRRIYAILSADVAEYSRLIESDEVGTARLFDACFAVIQRETNAANGRVANVSGDGVLALFNSVVSAVVCAIGFQAKIALLNKELPPQRQMEFRVGINSGDVLVTSSGRLHGDAVNVAARVQNLAQAGGILVTGVVHDQLQGRDGARLEFLRTVQLKNLSRDVHIYRVNNDSAY
jgi:class 3 adenylate cyclase